MNIAFDAQPLVDGQKTGVGYCEAGIVRELMSLYPDNMYTLEYFSFKNAEQKADNLKNFERENCKASPCGWFPGSLYRLLWNFISIPYRLFFGKQSDITHFFNFHVPPGVSGKTVSIVHDMAYKAFPETVRFKTKIMLDLSLKRSCRRADRILTVSEFSKRELMKYLSIPEERITVVPNGVDLERFRTNINESIVEKARKAYNIPKDYLLYLGTLEPRKNIERLIEAYAILRAEVGDIPALVLAGRKGWMYDSIFEKVNSLGLAQNVIFTGYVADGDAPPLLRGAMAFVFPSLYEGFGMPPLEAMACGTPVLTSDCSSLPEVVGDAAVLVDPYSVEDIAAGMKKLTEDKALRHTLSQKGLIRAKQFSWTRSAKIVMGVYEELLK